MNTEAAPEKRTSLQRSIGNLLGESPDTFVAARRKEGWSWRRIADEITERTGVHVTYESVRSWYSDSDGSAEADAS